MRRLISLCLVSLVCLSCLVVPAFASETGIDVNYAVRYISGSYVLRYPASSSVVSTGSIYPSGSTVSYSLSNITETTVTDYALVLTAYQQSYDYISFSVLVKADTIDGVAAVGKTGSYTNALPIEYSLVDSTDSDTLGYVWVTAIVDVDNYTDEVEFTLSGQFGKGSNSFTCYISGFQVSSYSGIVPDYMDETTAIMQDILAELQSQLTTSNSWLSSISNFLNLIYGYLRTWLVNLYNIIGTWGSNIVDSILTWGQNIVDAINGDSTSGDEFKDNSSSLNDQMGSISSSMNSVTVPDSSDVNMDVSGYVSGEGVTILSGTISSVLSTGNIQIMFIMAIMLTTAAYILYGKR